MQSTTTRLHPLLAAAAISVTVLSAVGVATMTGFIPVSKGQEQSAVQSAAELPKEIAPAITHPAPKPKPVMRKSTPRPVEPIYREFAEAPVVRPAPVIEAPKPAPRPGQLAIVESVREVKEAGDAKGVGAIGGGVLGGVVGNKLGKGKALFTVLGAAGGAVAGHQIEKQVRAEKRWEIGVRLDNGTQQTISSEVEPTWRPGERVRLLDGRLLPA